jgi:hypothetical protein
MTVSRKLVEHVLISIDKVPTLTAKDAQGTVEKAMYNAKYCFFFNADADPKVSLTSRFFCVQDH